jgi:hypothetical protein
VATVPLTFLASLRVRLEMNFMISIGYDGLQTLYPSFPRERKSRNAEGTLGFRSPRCGEWDWFGSL